MNEPQLNHGARRIAPNSLELLIEMFSLLGCEVRFREGEARWAMIGQSGVGFNIQLVEVDETPILNKSRTSSHIAFISENPTAIIEKIEEWSIKNNLNFKKGGWSDRELWFDLPDLFVDFVIEVMDKAIVGK